MAPPEIISLTGRALSPTCQYAADRLSVILSGGMDITHPSLHEMGRVMSDIEIDSGRTRDRSPSFPIIGIGKAVERTRKLFEKAKRHDARLADAAADWGLAPKSSSTLQTVAALLAYGLIESSAGSDGRKIKVSETGWRILEDQRPGVRDELLAKAALKPKLIAQYAEIWKDGRPDDSHAISQLKFESGLIDDAAFRFLRVYDENIGFVKLKASDNIPDNDGDTGAAKVEATHALRPTSIEMPLVPGPFSMRSGAKAVLMDGERELTTGLLSRTASFRLIVSGKIGEKEIERLIKKLALDKEILADQDDDNKIADDDILADE